METTQTTENVETNSIKSTSNNKPTIEDEGDRIFSEYVSSMEFVAYYNAIEDFNTNLSNRQTISDFETDEEMFSWIDNNLTLTKFSKLDDAIIDWNEIGSLAVQLDTKFPKVNEFYKAKTKFVIGEKIDKWFSWGMGLDFTTTLGSCADNLRDCRQAASDAYTERACEILDIVNEGTEHSTFEYREITKALNTYMEAVSSCRAEYHNCSRTN